MKFSLKNKEFNKKRLNIFDRKQSTSPNFKSLSKESLSKSKSPFEKIQKNNITISYDQTKNNFRQQNKSKQHKFNLSQLELSQIQEENGELINSNSSHYQNNLIKSQNKKILLNQQEQEADNTKSQMKQRRHMILPLSKPIQSVYHEQQKSIRQNMLINNDQIQSNKNYHPSSQIVFEPINRKSASKSQSKQKSNKQISQKAVNNKLQSSSSQKLVKQYNYSIKNNKVLPNQNNQKSQSTNHPKQQKFLQMQKNNIHLSNQIIKLQQTIQQQHLQIKYLKNQKQIMKSNQILKFDPKEQSYSNKKDYQQKNKQSPHKTSKIISQNYKYQEEQQNNHKLLQLYHILVKNQTQIQILQSNYKNVYASALIYIEKVQQKLVKVVSTKYLQYKNVLEGKLKEFDKYVDKCSYLEDKFNLYSNTVRSVNQSLRLTKLKQENIELQIKQNNIQKKNIQMQGFYKKNKSPQLCQKHDQKSKIDTKKYQIQSSPKIYSKFYKQFQNKFDIPDSQSDISSIKRIQYDYDEFEQKQDKKELYALSKNLQRKNNSSDKNQQSIQSFLDQKYSHLVYKGSKPVKNQKEIQQYKNKGNYHQKQKSIGYYEQSSVRSQIYEIDDSNFDFYNSQVKNKESQKLSPFQANKMFKNSYQKLNQVESRSRSFYQFQDEFPQNKKIYQDHKPANRQFINQYQAKNNQEISFQSPYGQIKKQLISDTLQQEQARIICIIQQKNYKFPVECWIDQMGCLRRKNHTYLFDSQGNVLVTTESAFKKLCEQNVFRNIS